MLSFVLFLAMSGCPAECSELPCKEVAAQAVVPQVPDYKLIMQISGWSLIGFGVLAGTVSMISAIDGSDKYYYPPFSGGLTNGSAAVASMTVLTGMTSLMLSSFVQTDY